MISLSRPDARFVAFLGTAAVFLMLVNISLLAPLFSGLLTFALVSALSRRLVKAIPHGPRANMLAASIVAGCVVILLVLAGFALSAQIRTGADVQKILEEMGRILTSARTWLPDRFEPYIPEQERLLASIADWLRQHAAAIGAVGVGTVRTIGYILIGIILGAMIGISDVTREKPLGPVANYLVLQVIALRNSFWRVASAQLKISALNTFLTGLYLAVALPMFGIHLPFTKTLILITFIAGLLPVLGNLISNTVIFVISLSASVGVAIASLTFLVVIHKLEYFVNARIVGGEIQAKAWEILVVMLVMERLFGVAGVIAGPVFYAWLKSEWHLWDQPRPNEDHTRD